MPKTRLIRYALFLFLIINLIALALLTYALTIGAGGWSPVIMLNLIAYGIFLIITFITLVHKHRLTAMTKIVTAVLAAASLCLIVILLGGAAQDLLGQQCSGFWGMDSSCIGSSWFIVAIIIGFSLMTPVPFALFATTIIIQVRSGGVANKLSSNVHK